MKMPSIATRLLGRTGVFTVGMIAAVTTPIIARAAVYEEIDFSCSYRCKTEVGEGWIADGELWYFEDCSTGANGSVTCIYRKAEIAW